jgi:hypothetical protein
MTPSKSAFEGVNHRKSAKAIRKKSGGTTAVSCKQKTTKQPENIDQSEAWPMFTDDEVSVEVAST